VTAQKRAESLSDVPILISAVTGASLEKQNIDSLATLSQSMPNVNIFEGAIDSTIHVRGVSPIITRGLSSRWRCILTVSHTADRNRFARPPWI
jgi:outer membrane receptor protein involved in Fe transport